MKKDHILDIHQLFMTLPTIWQTHSIRTAKIAARFFESIIQDDLYEEEQVFYTLQEVEQAMLYHDIGVLKIPALSLPNKIPCTDEQAELLRMHTVYGAGIIRRYRMEHVFSRYEASVWRLAAEVAISHHERWDGKGYPYGEVATAIPLVSRVMAIAVFYDIAVQNNGGDGDLAMKRLEANAGSRLDPRLVALFREYMEKSGRQKNRRYSDE